LRSLVGRRGRGRGRGGSERDKISQDIVKSLWERVSDVEEDY